MNYAYIRVSTNYQTVQNQKLGIREYAKYHRIRNIKWVAETISGTKNPEFQVVRGMFSQRRKTILNCVSGSLGIAKDTVLKAIEQTGLKPAARPEELSMDELILFSENLKALEG